MAMPLPVENRSNANNTDIPDKVSNATIMFLLFARSARIPSNGESKIVGIVAPAKILAYIAAEPVTSSTYIDRANFKM